MMRGITLIVKEPGDRYPKYIPVQWITDIEEEPSGPPILKGGRRRKSIICIFKRTRVFKYVSK